MKVGNKLELYGAHGTSTNNAENILHEGFNCGFGRVGKGVYFWEKSEYSEILATDWCRFQLSKGHRKDNRCAIITICISVNNDHFFDFESDQSRLALSKIVKKHKVNLTNTTDISKLFDMFLSMIESKLGVEIFVWRKKVAPPPDSYYPLMILGAPMCYITNKPELVKILEVKKKEIKGRKTWK